jgi:negative regulator of flagellin synthesis FlgM
MLNRSERDQPEHIRRCGFIKISPKDPSLNINACVKQVNRKQKTDALSELGAKPVDKADTVKISQEARELQETKKILKKMPDVQAGKVVKLKNRIENGTYEIRSGKTAEKIVKEFLLNELL